MIRTINDLAKQSQIILPGINEGEILTGSSEPEKIANFYLEQSPLTKIVVVKLGADGAFVKLKNGEQYFVSGFKVAKVVSKADSRPTANPSPAPTVSTTFATLNPETKYCSPFFNLLVNKVIQSGVVSVVRAESGEKALKIVEAVISGGITSIELTYSVPRANEVISDLVAKYLGTDVVIGAGTVLDPTSARLAIVAGAQFIVSPSFNKEVAKICNLYQIPYVPGILTPLEAQKALEYGSELIKLFPGDITGPKMIKDLKGPFPYINILPSGGVNVDNVAEWFAAGAVAVSAGGGVTAPAANNNYSGVTENAKKFMAAFKAAKK